MENEQDVSELPVSPLGQYMSTSALSLFIIGVLESEVAIDDLQIISWVRDLFLPVNPRFSSIMVTDNLGIKKWRKVEVRLKDHVKIPAFPDRISTKFYDDLLDDYISKIAREEFPQHQPLWEVHIIKYQTSNAAGNVIFKLHHSLGDGISLMGLLLSCLQRADNPSIPLTLPSIRLRTTEHHSSRFKTLPKIFSSLFNTVSDFCSGTMKNSFIEDDESPIRSRTSGVEFIPISVVTISFSLDQIKHVKDKLGVTINDVITGTIFLGVRLYMEAMSQGSGKARTTSVVVLNTRMFRGYKSVQEMVKSDAELPWGNRFALLPVSVPKLSDAEANPLQFIWKARKTIERKRKSFSAFLTAAYLRMLNKFRGSEAVGRRIHGKSKRISLAISNMIGPIEKMALANHPIGGLYFMVTGSPVSLMIGVVSYKGELRIAMQVEKDFIDGQKLKSYVETAFDMISKAASTATAPPN